MAFLLAPFVPYYTRLHTNNLQKYLCIFVFSNFDSIKVFLLYQSAQISTTKKLV